MPNYQQIITANNSLQNLGEIELKRATAFGNLSVRNPTIEEINAGVGSGDAVLTPPEQAPVEPAFGTHIREAAETLRRVVKG
jgi:hypothetical protein